MSDDGPYTFRARCGDELYEVEMTAEEAFDFINRGTPISHGGDGVPFVDDDGTLGERHVTGAEQARRGDRPWIEFWT